MGPQTFLRHWWSAVKPLPHDPVTDQTSRTIKRRQKRLISSTVWLVLLGACAWWAYDYYSRAPERALAEFEKGMSQMQPGTYDGAVSQFTRSIEIAPNLAGAYLNRAIALHALGERTTALEDLEHALALDSSLTRAYDERGRIYLEQKDHTRALQEFSRSIAIHPTTSGYYQRGMLYESLGEHEKAIADYDRAIVDRPDAPYAYRARALAKRNLGDNQGAQEDRAIADRIENIH
jgi:tetratricopeptide (TPR) repeat protein